jgi:hypothetical protein
MTRRGLNLDRVVLLGRTFDEYCRYFLLEPEELEGRRILDAAGGVSSFTAEANARGIHSISLDPIYRWDIEAIRARVGPDLEFIYKGIQGLSTYRWTFYRDPEHMRELRERASRLFLADFEEHPERYVPGELPDIPFADSMFDVALVSYLLFAYEENFSYEFHLNCILRLMRATRGEARIYPLVNFETVRSRYLDRILTEERAAHLQFEIVPTDFEFLANSNSYLRIRHRP